MRQKTTTTMADIHRVLYVCFALFGLIASLQQNLALLHHFIGAQRRLLRPILLLSPQRPRFKVRQKRRFWIRPGRTSRWWDNFETGVVIDEEWKENFRMSRASLISLSELLRPYIEGESTVMRAPSISSVYTGLMQGVGAAEKVFEYLDRKPGHPLDGQEAPDSCTGLVEFRDVVFAYPTRPEADVLKGVSFTLRPGEVTALVGHSGSGKSSCTGLLENFYRPHQGQVLLDGRPVHTYQHDYLHSTVALVSQEPVLFARTVEENIAYGLDNVSMEAVMHAATQANAHDFITTLTKGYDTGVGEKGAQLSGGQKQRVAIARALIRKPRVLILDEATSALDAESEHIVQQALNALMRERAVLVIAHRLSTVEKADNIVVLDRGCVAEQGTHSQLMASGGLYFKLVQRQVLGMETGAEVLNATEDHRARRGVGGGASPSGSESESESNVRY